MTLRSSFVLLTACLSLSACDSGSDSTSTGDSTSGGDGSSTGGTNPTGVSVSVSATNPTTDPSTTDATETATDTDGSTTDATATDTDGSTTDATDGTSTGEATGSTTGGETGTTIYDVQDGTIAEGETVMLEGVVITALREFIGVVVQEADGGEYSAVYVDTGDVDLSAFAVGDVVDITGITAESNPDSGALDGLTQILVTAEGSMTATGDTMALMPETVDFAVLADPETAEPWECVLVNTSGNFSAVTFGDFFGQYGEFAVQEGEAQLLVDNFLYAIFDKANAADFPDFAEGATFTAVNGVLNYSYGNFKVAPRSASELEGYMAPAP